MHSDTSAVLLFSGVMLAFPWTDSSSTDDSESIDMIPGEWDGFREISGDSGENGGASGVPCVKVGVLNDGDKHSIPSLPELATDISSSRNPHGKSSESNTPTFWTQRERYLHVCTYTACILYPNLWNAQLQPRM